MWFITYENETDAIKEIVLLSEVFVMNVVFLFFYFSYYSIWSYISALSFILNHVLFVGIATVLICIFSVKCVKTNYLTTSNLRPDLCHIVALCYCISPEVSNKLLAPRPGQFDGIWLVFNLSLNCWTSEKNSTKCKN